MKGISPVIATLLLLVITLGLIGMAYGYISGIFTAKTGKSIDEITGSASCTIGGAASWTVKNIGSTAIVAGDLSLTVISGCTIDPDVSATTITTLGITTIDATGCSSGLVKYKLIGPSNAIDLEVMCP